MPRRLGRSLTGLIVEAQSESNAIFVTRPPRQSRQTDSTDADEMRAWRQQFQLSQRKAATMLGYRQSSIASIEGGVQKIPTWLRDRMDTLRGIERAIVWAMSDGLLDQPCAIVEPTRETLAEWLRHLPECPWCMARMLRRGYPDLLTGDEAAG